MKKVGDNEQVAFTKALLASCNIHSKTFLPDSKQHVLPLLSTLWHREPLLDSDKIIKNYGPQTESPNVSVIIPIYGRYDFIAHQISAFKKDPSFDKFEII
ncbi:hypothetical protein CGH62_25010, partial [Vibrio parahaemolyticus]